MPGESRKSRPVSSTYTGTRAEQLMKGATSMVASRSRRSGTPRADMMPGSAQAWLESRGTKLWPGSPKGRSQRSTTNAARAR